MLARSVVAPVPIVDVLAVDSRVLQVLLGVTLLGGILLDDLIVF